MTKNIAKAQRIYRRRNSICVAKKKDADAHMDSPSDWHKSQSKKNSLINENERIHENERIIQIE